MNAYQRQREKQGQEYQQAREKQGLEYQQAREKQGLEYQQAREKQGQDYQKLVEKQMREFEDRESKGYEDRLTDWRTKRTKTIGAAEGKIKAIVDNYGRTFKGGVVGRWTAMAAIILVVLVLVMIFQKRKDTI